MFFAQHQNGKNVLSCRTWRHTSKIEITKTKRTEILHSVLFCCSVSLLFNFNFKHSRKQGREKLRRMYNNDFHTMSFLKILPRCFRLVIIICPTLISVTRKVDYKDTYVRRADTAYTRCLTYIHRADLRKLFSRLKP